MSGERELLAEVLGTEIGQGWSGGPRRDDLLELAHALLPVVDRIANQRAAQALTQTANVWQYSVWADMPRSAGRVADRIEAAQFVTDWLRARADALDPS